MDYKQQIVTTIKQISGEYSEETIFSDWVRCMALAYQNSCYLIHNKLWEKREELYLQTMNKYNSENQRKICEMHALLTLLMEMEISDYLGQIYMEADCGSKATGQFFTPFHISVMAAEIAVPKDVSEEKKYVMNEPSAGGGGMILAAAKVIRQRGLNYQNCMKVTAQDLDWRSVYMTYVQLCMLGINAEVIRMNTLSGENPPADHIFYTPRRMGALF